MSIRPLTIGGAALLLFLGLSPGLAAQEQPPQPPATETTAVEAPAAQEPEAPAETMNCRDCHEQAAAFTHNPHARGNLEGGEVPNGVCESCHDGGAAHMEAGGDPSLITVPRGLAGANQTCLSCHDNATDRKTHRTGMHANTAAVNCFSCHSVHHSSIERLLIKPQPALCASCHAAQVTSMKHKPYAHRMGRAGLQCSTCHEPHGRRDQESLRRTAAGEQPCYGCHTDKRGPFVFNHGAVAAADCASCHEPHGSSNPKMLKRANVAQLCLECHSTITQGLLGSQPPSFHNLTQPRYQNCTTCHVAIHGSNRSPALLK